MLTMVFGVVCVAKSLVFYGCVLFTAVRLYVGFFFVFRNSIFILVSPVFKQHSTKVLKWNKLYFYSITLALEKKHLSTLYLALCTTEYFSI